MFYHLGDLVDQFGLPSMPKREIVEILLKRSMLKKRDCSEREIVEAEQLFQSLFCHWCQTCYLSVRQLLIRSKCICRNVALRFTHTLQHGLYLWIHLEMNIGLFIWKSADKVTCCLLSRRICLFSILKIEVQTTRPPKNEGFKMN